jgi:hypothetical protein
MNDHFIHDVYILIDYFQIFGNFFNVKVFTFHAIDGI